MIFQSTEKKDFGSDFFNALHEVIDEITPRIVIETGTYLGMGSTKLIAEALRDQKRGGHLISIEVNPNFFEHATRNLVGLPLTLSRGLSIARTMLPSMTEISGMCAELPAGIGVDFAPHNRAETYFKECDYNWLPDGLLETWIDSVNRRVDLLLLDSAGHLGFIEFRAALTSLRDECIIAFKDVRHLKHYRSYDMVKADSRFEIVKEGAEGYGFCVARFKPQGDPQQQ